MTSRVCLSRRPSIYRMPLLSPFDLFSLSGPAPPPGHFVKLRRRRRRPRELRVAATHDTFARADSIVEAARRAIGISSFMLSIEQRGLSAASRGYFAGARSSRRRDIRFTDRARGRRRTATRATARFPRQGRPPVYRHDASISQTNRRTPRRDIAPRGLLSHAYICFISAKPLVLALYFSAAFIARTT